jgi:hypothetical protein
LIGKQLVKVQESAKEEVDDQMKDRRCQVAVGKISAKLREGTSTRSCLREKNLPIVRTYSCHDEEEEKREERNEVAVGGKRYEDFIYRAGSPILERKRKREREKSERAKL